MAWMFLQLTFSRYFFPFIIIIFLIPILFLTPILILLILTIP
jgi:hypothetical protein